MEQCLMSPHSLRLIWRATKNQIRTTSPSSEKFTMIMEVVFLLLKISNLDKITTKSNLFQIQLNLMKHPRIR
jgi:hypothetical protein